LNFITNEDRLLYLQVLQKKRNRDFAGSANDAKYLIDHYDSSKYFLAALDELYLAYKYSDTVRNQSATNVLFGSLKTYLEQKIQQYSSRQSFVDKAYHYFLMCLVKMRNFQEAIGGYENIMNNHPDPVVRLTASWERAAAILLMNTGGGGNPGSQFEVRSWKLNDELTELNELLDKNPAHKIAADVLSEAKGTASVDGQYYEARGYNKTKLAVIESRIEKFTPSSREELNEKVNQDINVILGVGNVETARNNVVPQIFRLYQNYPNPFNPLTTIKYDIPRDVNVTITIYDLLGRQVAVILKNEFRKAGRYEEKWNGNNYSSGVYFYRIEAGSFVDAMKMILVK